MNEEPLTTSARVEAWLTVKPLLDAMVLEFRELSKKKPDGVASVQKVKVVNRVLERCREALEDEPTLEFLDLLSEDNVPQNSDVILMLSQYAAAMEVFKRKYHRYDRVELQNRWFTEDEYVYDAPDEEEDEDSDDDDSDDDPADRENGDN